MRDDWDSDSDLFRAAVHEGGHAVAAYLLSVPIASMYVTVAGDGELNTGLTVGDHKRRGISKQGALVARAGPRAEEALCPGFRACHTWDADRRCADRHVLQIEPIREMEAFRETLDLMTGRLVSSRGFLEAVKVLAHKLVSLAGSSKQMDGDQVVAVLDAVLGGRRVTMEELMLADDEGGLVQS